MGSLLYKKSIPVTDRISVRIPTVGEILDNEDLYYWLVHVITATPYDMMVFLDDAGVDFTAIDDYQLFLWLFDSLKECDTSLVFDELDLSSFEKMINPSNGMAIIKDRISGIVIDKLVFTNICNALRKIHHLKRNAKTPANSAAKKYMIQRARDKLKRQKGREASSHLEELIIALVNTEQFHYRFDDVRDLSIYQFNESALQVIKKIDFDNRMHGIYSGTISAKDMSQDDLNWLTHK